MRAENMLRALALRKGHFYILCLTLCGAGFCGNGPAFCELASVVQDVQHLTQTRPQMQRLNVETPSMPVYYDLQEKDDTAGPGQVMSCHTFEFLHSRLKGRSQLEMQPPLPGIVAARS